MSKIAVSKIAALLGFLVSVPLLVAVANAGCTSTATTVLTDCQVFTPDAGTDPNLTCAIGWTCNSGDTQLQITCTADPRPEYYDCSCSNGTTTTQTTTQAIVVDTFICDPMGALPTANMGCNFNIQ